VAILNWQTGGAVRGQAGVRCSGTKHSDQDPVCGFCKGNWQAGEPVQLTRDVDSAAVIGVNANIYLHCFLR
jgi:hypothetical protein